MFNFLVSGHDTAWEERSSHFQMHKSRFGEFSGSEYESLQGSRQSLFSLLEQSMAFLVYEIGVDEPHGSEVKVGQLRDIHEDGQLINFSFEQEGTMPRSVLEENQSRMRIHDWEWTRTHWAIKDGRVPQDILRKITESPKSYDFVVSFAGTERQYARKLAHALREGQATVFFDEMEESRLWGKDLAEEFQRIYRDLGQFCIILVSNEYLERVWTKHERKSALERAMGENREYILPVKFDNVDLPGISKNIGYLDGREKAPENIAALALDKLGTPFR